MILNDKVAIVLGGAHGVGKAIVERLSGEGAKVVIADTLDNDGKKLAGSISSSGREARYRRVDLTAKLDLHNLITTTTEAYGRIDLLVNTIAVGADAPFLELREEQFDQVFETNLRGLLLATQAVARQMVQQHEENPDAFPGLIININNWNICQADLQPALAISLGGQTQLMHSLAEALRPHEVRVNTIGLAAPSCESPSGEDTKASVHVQQMGQTSHQNGGKSVGATSQHFFDGDIPAAVLWLAENDCPQPSGQTLWLQS